MSSPTGSPSAGPSNPAPGELKVPEPTLLDLSASSPSLSVNPAFTSLAASALSSSSSPCGFFIEELRDDGLTSRDSCSCCHHPVGNHSRRPPLPSSSSSSSTTRRVELSPFLKLTARLPTWNKTPGTVCFDFIKQINMFYLVLVFPKVSGSVSSPMSSTVRM